ncbi:TPA: hypothetical protein ACYF3T_005973, partial [Klebsiella pneumoniae]
TKGCLIANFATVPTRILFPVLMASVEEHVILLSYLCHTGAGGVFYHGDFGHKKGSDAQWNENSR